MLVLKFGGTSVANAVNMGTVLRIVEETMQRDKQVVVVLSALGGTTDALIDAVTLASKGDLGYQEKLQILESRHLTTVKELIPIDQQSGVLSMVKQKFNAIEDICRGVFLLRELSLRTKDAIISFGELLSSLVFAEKLKSQGTAHVWMDCREMIATDSQFGNALVDFAVTNARLQSFFAAHPSPLIIAPGFIAADKNGQTTTLGRGGSDYTAAIIAAALQADVLEIWTDVSGMMTADPRLVSNARIIEQISYKEAMELSHFGAKVIYPPTIQPVMNQGIPIWIKNTFAPKDPGTLIENAASQHGGSICGISSISKINLLSLEGSGMVGIPGFSKRLFEALSQEKINVILITQSSSEHSICVGIEEHNTERAKEVVDRAFDFEIETKKVEPLVIERNLAIVALVGDGMKNHTGISGKMFGALGRNGINIRGIAQGSSERNISAVISTVDVKKAINVLHEEFFETTYKQVNLFISGIGNVGSRLLAQLQQQLQFLEEKLRLQVRVAGIATSRTMVLDDQGIDLGNWRQPLENGEPMNVDAFARAIVTKNLRNSIFVDITANGEVAKTYPQFLERSISVVACNKIACSSAYEYYDLLKSLAREYHANFLFETNVGAGLPIIGTLNDLLRSGDKVNRIEAVLSGTLNFVFNHYTGEKSFAQVVRQAQDEGYTEPDPRLDLGGTDVMRKILILARETGARLEMEDITNHSFMPAACMEGDVDNFYAEMEKHEAYFQNLLKEAQQAGKKLKFVAKYEDGKAAVGLQHIDPRHDFFHLYGKDNAVSFYTNRYSEQPLVVKGAGAGAEVTASGVFADIIRAAAPTH